MPREQRFQSIDGDDLYRRLATGDPVVLVDVRTETEYARGHIPGSMLVPLHEIESLWREIPNGGTPVAVVCSYGIRSQWACRFLAERGFESLCNVRGGLAAWPGPTAAGLVANGGHRHPIAPARFLVESYELLPKGTALDLAAGQGRNAIYLASRGFDVDAVDIDAEAIARARVSARRLAVPIRAVVGNVEDGTYILPIDTYDVIVGFNYLHRPLFTDIRDGLRPGGVVVYQTFTVDQPKYGKPTDPAFLLRPGELRSHFQDWDILRYREAVESDGPGCPSQAVAGIVARKPTN